MRTILSLLQAFLFVVSAFSVEDSNFKEWVDDAALGVTSTRQCRFSAITAQELAVTPAETQRCRDWFETHVRLADGDLSKAAFTLSVGGKAIRLHPNDWDVSTGAESAAGAVYKGGKTSYITLTHRRSGLTVTVEATIYEAYATCEWTAFVRNAADTASPVVSQFYAADCVLPTGYSSVYLSRGSSSDANDFELVRSMTNFLPTRYTANGGRSASFLPYFNICGSKVGVLMAVGWTGQWLVSTAQRLSGVAVKAAQETFRAYLDPDEMVRSPLVSLTFYENKNALKGFNVFRNWETDCVAPEGTRGITTQGLMNEFSRKTGDELVKDIRDLPQAFCDEADYLWIDAGWYTNEGNWYDTVGDWIADPTRFPQGMKPVSDAAHARGMGLLLWFEPERCCKGTRVFDEAVRHDGWLFQKNDSVNMVNLANDDACVFLGNLVAQSIRDNGVDVYRQDFNFTPLPLWEEADKTLYGGRQGLEENHYVTNLYRYLDMLREQNPGLLIDNCASGGRRIDLEMTRRSIPLWRSDYNCTNSDGESRPDILEATQLQTYALSFWLPVHGTGAYVYSEYADRTNILPCTQRMGYQQIRRFMTENYFPLTYGGLRTNRFHAMQYGTANAGMALVYKRENVSAQTYALRLNGLEASRNYRVWDYDDPDTTYTLTGAQLMDAGWTLAIPEAPKAVIVLYEAQG